PQLSQSEHASVVNISSVGAFMYAKGASLYVAMKAGLLAVTRSYAGELGPLGIRVNAIAPGTVDTDMVRNNGPDAARTMSAGQIIKRAASPDEMVGPALFLASDASSFVTGQVLMADGGMHPN
ncbi:MAG: SDR family oxidoreductase, partial [Acidimicrobiales bacterium]